jgi:hypothetical protein
MRKENCKREEHNRLPKGTSAGRFFSKFTSPKQSYAAALHQDTQHQQPQASQTDEKNCGPPCSSSCHKRKFRKQVCQHRLANVVQLIITDFSVVLSGKDKIMSITNMV